ncbi:MAG: VanZ family protein [Syntrophales bacterium]|jgi:VanZ family protein|nr:VanZ family protein [Syntrophales bacterium]NLN60467.1 VanZ family protein [Deltaproteobacteria bacterium]
MLFKPIKWVLLWALFILILCGIPGKDIPDVSFLANLNFDKLVHAGIFFVFILLTIRGFMVQTRYSVMRNHAKLLAFVMCVAYGYLMEVMQGRWFEGRSMDVYDFIANTFGCVMGLVFYNRISRNILGKFLN